MKKSVSDSTRFRPPNHLRSSSDALRFLVDFAQLPGDVVMSAEPLLRQVLAIALERPDEEDWASTAWRRERPLSRSVVRRLQADVDMIVTPLAVEMGEAATIDVQLRFRVARGPGGVWVLVEGDRRHRFSYRVLRLIDDVGVDKVRQCACGRVFVKVTRKEFCSTRCQMRFYMRTVRAKERQHGNTTKRAR
jgi:hypothetical protein